MCAEPLFVIPVCEKKICAKNSNISRLWLVENGDRVGPVDGSVVRCVEKLIGAPVQRWSNSIWKIMQRRNVILSSSVSFHFFSRYSTPYCYVCRFVWSTSITMLSVTNSCEIISLCLWINTDLLIKSWIAMKITSVQPFSFSLCFTPLPCPTPWVTLLPCAPIPPPPPPPTMGNTPAMCTYPPTPPPPTMGNTPAMCTYPLPPPQPWVTLLPCAPIPLPHPPTMGNTPAMCTYPLPPPYQG